MGLLRRRVGRRFPALGLLSDLALVGTAAQRLVRRRGGGTGGQAVSAAEMALAGGAALRLLNRWRRGRKARRVATG